MHTCWLNSIAYFRVEASVLESTVFPHVFSILQLVLKDVLATHSWTSGLPSVPSGLKATTVGKEKCP